MVDATSDVPGFRVAAPWLILRCAQDETRRLQCAAMHSDAPRQRFSLRRLPSRSTTFADDVRNGLGATPKSLPPRWFYDALGSALFSAITNLPEYYVTRTEESILAAHDGEIAEALGSPVALVELGSGDSRKTRLLIDALLRRQGALEYVPIDIDATVLESSARHLLADFPALSVNAICS